MPTPEGLPVTTLVGLYVQPDGNGTPMQGTLTFFPAPGIIDFPDQDVMVSGSQTVTLDSNGAFSVTLVATDTPNAIPSGWTYKVTVRLTGVKGQDTFNIFLPYSATTVHLDDIRPTTAAPTYLPVAGPAGAAGAPGIIQDINGHSTANVTLTYADLPDLVGLVNNQTISGIKTFSASPLGPDPTLMSHFATKGYVDTHGGTSAGPWVFDAVTHGHAKFDGRIVNDAAIDGTTAILYSPSGEWVAADLNRYVNIVGAGLQYVTTWSGQVTAYIDANHIQVSGIPPTAGTWRVWIASDDTAAIQSCIDDGYAWATGTTNGVQNPLFFHVTMPPGLAGIAGPLRTDVFGNGQLVSPVRDVALNKCPWKMSGVGGGATTQHWDNVDGQWTGTALMSFGVFPSQTAQGDSVGFGNPCVIGGPAQNHGYGTVVAGEAKVNAIEPQFDGFQVLVPHSVRGWSYCGIDWSGQSSCTFRDFGVMSIGSVKNNDFANPSELLSGYAFGILLPANGNNDHTYIDDLTIVGFSRGLGATEHTVISRLCTLYCGNALYLIGNYYSSAGSVHGVEILSWSCEACKTHVFFQGQGSGGVGPFIEVHQWSVETAQPYLDGSDLASMLSARGVMKMTGSSTASGLTLAQGGCGVLLVDQQNGEQVTRYSVDQTINAFDRSVIGDTSGAARTFTLPNANQNPVEYRFRREGTNSLVIQAAPGQTIYWPGGSGNTYTLTTDGQAVLLKAYASSWRVW